MILRYKELIQWLYKAEKSERQKAKRSFDKLIELGILNADEKELVEAAFDTAGKEIKTDGED